MQSVRILEMPACKMVSSGIGMFGEICYLMLCFFLSPAFSLIRVHNSRGEKIT